MTHAADLPPDTLPAHGAHGADGTGGDERTGSLRGLRGLNLGAAALHAAQAVAVLVLANDFALPVTAGYLNGPPGSDLYEQVTLFSSPVGLGVALFLALSAFFHLLVASPWGRPRYLAGLREHHNYFRWVEYSLSSSVMIVLIAQITGIADVVALIGLFAVNATMILFGWLQERYEEPGSGRWLPFVFGSMAGSVPWLAVLLYVVAPGSQSEAAPPGFVYGIVVSLFLFFNVFGINQALQYARVGPWRRYAYGERAYVVLSLVAKSLLAWQVFGGTLAG